MAATLQCAEIQLATVDNDNITMTFAGTSNDFMVNIDRVGNTYRLSEYFKWNKATKQWVELSIKKSQYPKFNLAVNRTLQELL